MHTCLCICVCRIIIIQVQPSHLSVGLHITVTQFFYLRCVLVGLARPRRSHGVNNNMFQYRGAFETSLRQNGDARRIKPEAHKNCSGTTHAGGGQLRRTQSFRLHRRQPTAHDTAVHRLFQPKSVQNHKLVIYNYEDILSLSLQRKYLTLTDDTLFYHLIYVKFKVKNLNFNLIF